MTCSRIFRHQVALSSHLLVPPSAELKCRLCPPPRACSLLLLPRAPSPLRILSLSLTPLCLPPLCSAYRYSTSSSRLINSSMKLYLSQLNSYQQTSENNVLDCYPFSSSLSSSSSTSNSSYYGVILDDSCLYPEGGGQPWDLGTLDGQEVMAVEVTSKGLQVTVKEPIAIGATVLSVVDWNRRYDFMQQHSCQHLLSATIHQLYGWETLKWELGRSNVGVDFNKESEFTNAEIETIESAMNGHIRSGRLITASVSDREALESLPLLRGAPKGVAAEFDQLRIISIDGYDSNPCGGTHLTTTAEIQMFKIIGQEKDRGATRLRFLCGNRIFRSLSASLINEMELSRLLCIQTSEIVPTVTTLFSEKKELVKQIKTLQDEVAMYYAQELVQLWCKQPIKSRNYVIQHRAGASLSFLQLTADTILHFNETQGLGIQAIFLSGSEESSSAASVSCTGNKKKKSKSSGPAIPPTEFSLVVPPSPQSGSFIFYATNSTMVDQLKGEISSLLEGKAGGRPGKLQGQGNALQNLAAVDELLMRSFGGNEGKESSA